MPRIPDALLRVTTVLLLLVGSLLFLRFVLLPEILTDLEGHKARAREREAAKPIKHAGSLICQDCHEEQPGMVAKGYHSALSCETCHGPAQPHVEDFEVQPNMPNKREFCSACHTYDRSRPTGFPQINPIAHNPMEPCIKCHEPHDPKPPETPQECSACHAEIARTKAVSHHVRLECTICHETPEDHKTAPRMARPGKPFNRDFCGTCHAEDSGVGETLKVDLREHGGRYLCWQCHYPHQPEGRQ